MKDQTVTAGRWTAASRGYAPYLNARQNGSSSAEAAVAADRYMEENS